MLVMVTALRMTYRITFRIQKFPHLISFIIVVVNVLIVIIINLGPSSLPLSPVDLGYDLPLVPPLRFSVELMCCCDTGFVPAIETLGGALLQVSHPYFRIRTWLRPVPDVWQPLAIM